MKKKSCLTGRARSIFRGSGIVCNFDQFGNLDPGHSRTPEVRMGNDAKCDNNGNTYDLNDISLRAEDLETLYSSSPSRTLHWGHGTINSEYNNSIIINKDSFEFMNKLLLIVFNHFTAHQIY